MGEKRVGKGSSYSNSVLANVFDYYVFPQK